MAYVLASSMGFFLLWLALSGVFQTLFLALGLLSALLVSLLALRMETRSHLQIAIRGSASFALYALWLLKEILLANIHVARIILSPKKRVQPQLLSVPVPQKSNFSRTLFANSITLTPGTVTLSLSRDQFLVHSLAPETGSHEALSLMSDKILALEKPLPQKMGKKE